MVALAVLLTGCVPQGLAFRIDDRLTFTSPDERATVELPVVLEWEVQDFEIVEPGGAVRDDAGYFAVFVDRAPMPPNQHLSWIGRKDRSCRPADGCPDEAYLNARGVHTTADTRLVLEQLPRTSDNDDPTERHRIVVVLLDAGGSRLGESAFELIFDLARGTS